MAVATVALKNFVNRSPNDTLNVTVVGITGRPARTETMMVKVMLGSAARLLPSIQ